MNVKLNALIDKVLDTDFKQIEKDFFDSLNHKDIPNNGYAIPMLFCHALACSDLIVDKIPRLSSADHISVFKALSTILEYLLNRTNFDIKSFTPFFDKCIEIDTCVAELFDEYFGNLFYLNFITSIREGYWDIVNKEEYILFSINKKMRRSALNILATKAEYFSCSEEVRDILDNIEKYEPEMLPLKQGIQDLEILYNGVPEAWEFFLNGLKYTPKDIVSFRGFMMYIRRVDRIWFRYKDLWKIWGEYAKEFKQEDIEREIFDCLLDFFSIKPGDAVKWGVQIPFIKIGDWYAYWFFYFHAMNPNLTLLSLWIRKYNRLWSNTLGSKMADVSAYIESCLPIVNGVFTVSQRLLKGISDIDLAVYDSINNHLLICEVKTVFDKFRTNYQFTNFLNQKVNYVKASSQLMKIIKELTNNNKILECIVCVKIKQEKMRITHMVLTWWDISNPNIDTSYNDILCCNFKTFLYLYRKTNGDIGLLSDSIKQLANIFCPAGLVYDSVLYNNQELKYIREVQTDLLPPLSNLNGFSFNAIVIEEINNLAKFPEDWKEQVKITDDDPELFNFY